MKLDQPTRTAVEKKIKELQMNLTKAEKDLQNAKKGGDAKEIEFARLHRSYQAGVLQGALTLGFVISES